MGLKKNLLRDHSKCFRDRVSEGKKKIVNNWLSCSESGRNESRACHWESRQVPGKSDKLESQEVSSMPWGVLNIAGKYF